MVARRNRDPCPPRCGRSTERRGSDDEDDEPDDHALGRAVGGVSTKIHRVSDQNGVPLDARRTAGQTQEATQVEALREQVAVSRAAGGYRRRPKRLAADRSDAARRIRHWLRKRGIQAVMPSRRRTRKPNRGRPCRYNKTFYRRRSTIEQCVGWLKEGRAVAPRYETLARTCVGLVKLAFIERDLRLLSRVPASSHS